MRGASCRAAGMEGRERAPFEVGRYSGLPGANSGPILGRGLVGQGWDSGRVVPGDLLNPMSGFGDDDETPCLTHYLDKLWRTAAGERTSRYSNSHHTTFSFAFHPLVTPSLGLSTSPLPPSFPFAAQVFLAVRFWRIRAGWPTLVAHDMQGPALDSSVALCVTILF